MTNYYVSSVAYASVAQWAATHTYSVGQYVRQLAAPAYGNERVFKATSITTGISGGSEPAWNLGNNATTTDSGVTWTEVAGQEAEQSAGNWKAPLDSLQGWHNLFNTGASPTDFIFISNDHVEPNTGAVSLTAETGQFMSVSRVGVSLPPTETDLSPGATLKGAGSNTTCTFALNNGGYAYGLFFTVSTGTSSVTLVVGSAAGQNIFDTCNFDLSPNTSTSSRMQLGHSGGGNNNRTVIINPRLKFGSTSQALQYNASGVDTPSIIGCKSGRFIDGTGSMPTSLFTFGLNSNQPFTIKDSDLTDFTGTALFVTTTNLYNQQTPINLINCKLPASDPLFAGGSVPNVGSGPYTAWNCDDASGNSLGRFQQRYSRNVFVLSSNQVARVGGAAIGSQNIGWASLTTNSAIANGQTSWTAPGGPVTPIVVYNSITGSSKTASVEIASATALTAVTGWIVVEYLGSSSGSNASTVTSGTATPLGTASALTASSADWTALAPARQNTTAYVAKVQGASPGNAIKVASNPGRIFVCITGGTAAGSEPVGYSTAVDGTQVTDGTAVFVACFRYKLSASFTPNRVGLIRTFVRHVYTATDIANHQVFIDPMVTVT